MTQRPPIVLVTSCNRPSGEHPFHVAGRKYVDAVRLAGALPLIAPPFGADEVDALLDTADGVLLTGSQSNVHPSHFGEAVLDPSLPLDPERDAWTLPLIRRALERGVPLFGICRGAQEANVALGGTLYQAVHEAAGRQDHRAPAGQPAAVQYDLAHRVDVAAGGLLAAITGRQHFEVNSVHGQGVRDLAPGLCIEAVAPDGLVEAFSRPDAPGFNLCVQWHPEWRAADNPVSVQLFNAFGVAVRAYRDRVRGPLPRVPAA
ncbi:gamma-glutamyl-gamma-aminobutyrate hydrolase family protein [Rubrivivax gelatinosus]|uniref:Gamma-glutamyl-gamma-aminobutyrate hydrolase n=1 Tax=Rubrivivax gelatinosus TaxID=28068 RepID=A0ABS1DU64_RUBGE|nr:gamma-glutamyl-gamma-aminobutyrate hydrolase family protein [Rubrivivax gelatinosus]MBK1713155.1 gamma-glutamyl-gamma-aminobutyrate hydrolase [Rubrivivax gelatinosus]